MKKSHLDLARKILVYARDHDLAVSSPLREITLAQRFSVSRSPIRAALRLLSQYGLVDYVPNRGFHLARNGADLEPALNAIPSSDEDRLFLAVVHDYFNHQLSERISVSDLMQRYDVSRSKSAAVIQNLSEDGLLERTDGRRWQFMPSLNNPEVYEESYRFRLLIEPAALREPGFMADLAGYQHQRRAHQELIDGQVYRASMSRLVEIDAKFHEFIGQCSGNRFFAQAIRYQNRLRRLTEYQFAGERERLLQSCREHLMILDAINVGNLQLAAQQMHEHISFSRDLRPIFSDN